MVINYYKAPTKVRYNEDGDYGSDGAPAPVRDVTTGRKNKSVDFGRSGSKNVKSD